VVGPSKPASKRPHACAQGSHASVGLAQAHPNRTLATMVSHESILEQEGTP